MQANIERVDRAFYDPAPNTPTDAETEMDSSEATEPNTAGK